MGIATKKADPSILDLYSDIRRKKYQEIVDPISSANLRRMFPTNPDEILENDEFLQTCKQAESDPHLASEMLQVSVCVYGRPYSADKTKRAPML